MEGHKMNKHGCWSSASQSGEWPQPRWLHFSPLQCLSTVPHFGDKTNSRGLKIPAGFVCLSILKAFQNAHCDRNRLLHARVFCFISRVYLSPKFNIDSMKSIFLRDKIANINKRAREIPCGERLTCMCDAPVWCRLCLRCRFLDGCKNCWKENGRFLCQMEICWDWILCGGGSGAYVGWVGGEVYRKKSKYFRSAALAFILLAWL